MHDGKGGIHYKKHGKREVCEHMEDEQERVFYELLGLNFGDAPIIRNALKRSFWAGVAVKHELRTGTKEGNTPEQEAEKAKNYRHRQETGEWIKK